MANPRSSKQNQRLEQTNNAIQNFRDCSREIFSLIKELLLEGFILYSLFAEIVRFVRFLQRN